MTMEVAPRALAIRVGNNVERVGDSGYGNNAEGVGDSRYGNNAEGVG